LRIIIKIFEDKVVKIISQLICDKCGELAIPSDNNMYGDSLIVINISNEEHDSDLQIA